MVSLVNWPEIEAVLAHKRFELVLKEIATNSRSPPVNDEELQKAAFPKKSVLNFLYILNCGLNQLHPCIANCANMTNLVLKGNKLKTLPSEVGELKQLKLIDVSFNELETLPTSMRQLENLQSLDLAKNKLTTDGLFDFSGLVMLHILEASNNALTRFPPSLASPRLVKLHTVNLSSNQIADLPMEFSNVQQMKDLKMAHNQLTETPLCLALLERIKFLDLSENPFKDRRFRKLANDKRAKVPSVLDYIRKKYDDWDGKDGGDDGKGKGGGENGREGEEEEGEVLRVTTHAPNMSVRVLDSVRAVRPHLLACVLRNVVLSNGADFRKFINLQNKLHQTECGHRTRATIGTHDATALRLPLRYLALPHDELFITALHKKSPVSARDLLSALLLDAELARKREKRSTVSAVHRYLHLVKDLPLLPCLIDADGLVISLAPLTNSDLTKPEIVQLRMSETTTTVLVEVSSADSMQTCYEIMDALIAETRRIFPGMEVDQIRAVSEAGDLLGEYPARSTVLEGVRLALTKYDDPVPAQRRSEEQKPEEEG